MTKCDWRLSAAPCRCVHLFCETSHASFCSAMRCYPACRHWRRTISRRTSQLISKNILMADTSRHGIASLDRALVRCIPSVVYTDCVCETLAQESDAAQDLLSRMKAATLFTSISVRQTACNYLVDVVSVHTVPQLNLCLSLHGLLCLAHHQERSSFNHFVLQSRPACRSSL